MLVRRSLFSLVALLLCACTFTALAQEKKIEETGEWIQLFNGKNLEGWTPKIRYHELGENWNDTFRVEDGLLKVSYDKYDKFNETFGHLFYKTPFSNYVLRLEYRFVGQQCAGGPGWAVRNSGAMIHGEMPETMSKDQDFPASIEVQLLGGNGKDPRTNANLCTPGTNVVMKGELVTRHCTNSTSETFHGDQWVTVEIRVLGNKAILHKINDKTVLSYTEPQLDERDAHAKMLAEKAGTKQLSGGSISLQSESHPIEFRKVELKLLKTE
ncbi:hypothetical protein ETAA8_67190 [Anatilimnocola aggregata]|uniref:3-keto-alpha-glucoside-1,2-lyase/3-keto-2-hydroxy-glucal hydratase domain-containing protein n=1 Tax=Anatilimnocola aggregata TaxID=2528021 RepID=A0A517YMV8_9BACT|nr:DUF1080 domain-containing protein [Anatilimnocola aggregata]QDU31560.1 hypothetical protein ETAA8_67190 [Anatilimnocola aggregata]